MLREGKKERRKVVIVGCRLELHRLASRPGFVDGDGLGWIGLRSISQQR